MEIKILKEKENPLFSRKEVEVQVINNVTPTKEEAKRIISDKFSCDSNLVRIIKISSNFGSRKFIVYADIYSSLEEFNLLVRKTKKEIEEEKKALEARKAEEEAKKAAEEEKKAEKQNENVESEENEEKNNEEKTE